MPKNFRSLQPTNVVDTIERLERRIAERFPGANLRQVAAELVVMAREAADRAQRIGRPNVPLRVVQWVLMACCLALIAWVVRQVRLSDDVFKLIDFAQTMDGLISCLAALGGLSLFVFSWELRLKRRQALTALHELRSMAHIVDMHQLTKDPERLLQGGPATPSSPQRTMTPFELGRYLDYSSEMLSMISKTAAIYVQEFPDSVALDAVNEITSLTNGLSRNIWQKIMLLDRVTSARDAEIENDQMSHAASSALPASASLPTEGATKS